MSHPLFFGVLLLVSPCAREAHNKPMSNIKDPKFGMVGGDKDSFETWALENTDLNNFDLVSFIGADEDNNSDSIEYGSTEQDQKHRREDKIFTTQQYNHMMFNDFSNNMHNAQFESYENHYPEGVTNFIGTNGDNRGILSNNVGYSNVVDSSMIPTTSKSAMPMPIKIEPDYGHEQHIGSNNKLQFDDSGHYSDADSYSHSIGSVGAYDHYDGMFHPKTKPRKYRVKPLEEKQNPVYKIKREKNNDAVRRSRDKAKRIQIEKDERLAFLEQETVRKDRTIQQLRLQNEKYHQQLALLERICSCGATARI